MGARQMVTVIRQDYAIKVSEYVYDVGYASKKVDLITPGLLVLTGSLSTGSWVILNQTQSKLVGVAVLGGDTSGLQELWSIGQSISTISEEDSVSGFILGLTHTQVNSLGWRSGGVIVIHVYW